jgi:hypothetical protein
LVKIWAGDPLRTIQVTLKGEVFYVSEVSTVQDLQNRLEEESGLNATEQGSVTFQGKVLDPADKLAEAGLQSGDQVNIIPKRMADNWKMMNDMGEGLISLRQRMLSGGLQNVPAEEMKAFDVMMNLYRDLTKVPYMQEEMERFSQYLKNPTVAEQATDPDRVESLRQTILNNPTLLNMLSESSPATKVALQDSDIWLQHVTASVEKWKTMDGYELWQRLIDGRLFGT